MIDIYQSVLQFKNYVMDLLPGVIEW